MRIIPRGQQGFTLIELIVVIAILGVLAAIAVPTVGNYLGSSKKRAYEAEQDRIQTAVDAYYSSPDNTRYQGKRQYPIIGRGQTNKALVNATTTQTLTDDGNPFSATSTALWNPNGGREGKDLSSSWSDGDTDGFRTIDSGSSDTWTSVTVTRGSNTYHTDPRYFFIDFEALVSADFLDAVPKSAASDNKPSGSSQTYTGSYIWYVDDEGEVQSLYAFLPSTKGYEDGVFP